jgi:uncharacterized lipoprotein YmbA
MTRFVRHKLALVPDESDQDTFFDVELETTVSVERQTRDYPGSASIEGWTLLDPGAARDDARECSPDLAQLTDSALDTAIEGLIERQMRKDRIVQAIIDRTNT